MRRTDRLALAFFAVYALAWMLVAAWVRDLWLDEFWSMWFAQHDLSFVDALLQRWRSDPYPPLYSMANWLVEPLFHEEYFPLRLLNLVPFAYASLVAAYIYRTAPRARRALVFFAVLLVSTPAFLAYFTEVRSYFSQIAFSATLAFLLYVIVLEDRDLNFTRPAFLVLLIISSFLALNLHYVATLSCGCAIGVTAFVQLQAGRRRWFWFLLVLAAVSVAPLLSFMVFQQHFLRHHALNNFWIATTSSGGLVTIALQLVTSVGGNLIALGAVVLAGAAVIRKRSQKAVIAAKDGGGLRSPAAQYVLAMLIAIGISCVLLLAINLRSPIIVERYLVSMVVFFISAIAVLLAETLRVEGPGLVAVIANACVVLSIIGGYLLTRDHWGKGASRVAAVVRSCPQTQVYTREIPDSSPLQEREVMQFAYDLMAQRYGFHQTTLHRDTDKIPETSSSCPRVVWAEHVDLGDMQGEPTPAKLVKFLGLNVEESLVATSKLQMQRDHDGFVLILPAAH